MDASRRDSAPHPEGAVATHLGPSLPDGVFDCLFLSHPQPRDSGDYQHRVVLPGRALARHLTVAEVQTSHPAWLQLGLHAGLLVVKMVADANVLALMEARRALGRRTAYEISDDFCDFPASLPAHAFYSQPRHQALIEVGARRADLVQFSSHGLASKYGAFHAHRAVLPNQLAEMPPLLAPPAARRARPVLGWAGSAGHLEDARQLVAWLRPWYAARRQAGRRVPALRVMAPEAVAAVFLGSGLPVSIQAPGPFTQYLDFLRELDIGLALLGDTDFARGRSDGKFLEYASRGVVCVASASGEYLHGVRHGQTGLLFEGAPGLAACLDMLVDDQAQRERLRASAHAHVLAARTHALAAQTRAALYRSLLPEPHPSAAPPPDAALQSIVDPAEPVFLHASTLHQLGRVHEALEGYLEVARVHPGFHEPWARSALIARALGAVEDAQVFERMAGLAVGDAVRSGRASGARRPEAQGNA